MLVALGLFYGLMGVLTILAFGLDKGAAVLGKKRISEATLHRLEYLGGWPGALIAMRLFNHKNQKAPYKRGQQRAIALHCIAVSFIGFIVYWVAFKTG